MAYVVAVAQQKGGAGKSTVAANLAACLAAGGRRVALLDTDPQRSLSRWHEERQRHPGNRAATLHFAAAAGWRLSGAVERLRREQDWIILDTPPHAETDAKLAIRVADFVLMPVQPSAADLWASEATVTLAAAERRPVAALLNRVPAQGRLAREIAGRLSASGIPLLEPTLGNRAGYAQAFEEGLGVTEAAPRSAAAAEVWALEAVIRGLAGDGAAG
jgi:chromosome partitioning protein